MTSYCTKCKRIRAIKFFSILKKNDCASNWCKECRAAYLRSYRSRNAAQHKMYQDTRGRKLINQLSALKSKPCTDCGKKFPHYVMHFDHLDGSTKIADVARLCRSKAWKTVLAEVEKCELVCANCHAIRTWTRKEAARPKSR